MTQPPSPPCGLCSLPLPRTIISVSGVLGGICGGSEQLPTSPCTQLVLPKCGGRTGPSPLLCPFQRCPRTTLSKQCSWPGASSAGSAGQAYLNGLSLGVRLWGGIDGGGRWLKGRARSQPCPLSVFLSPVPCCAGSGHCPPSGHHRAGSIEEVPLIPHDPKSEPLVLQRAPSTVLRPEAL